MHTARFEIKFEVHHAFISQKLKKLKEEESLLFGPSCAANFLQLNLLLHPPRFWNIIFLPPGIFLSFEVQIKDLVRVLILRMLRGPSPLVDLHWFFEISISAFISKWDKNSVIN